MDMSDLSDIPVSKQVIVWQTNNPELFKKN